MLGCCQQPTNSPASERAGGASRRGGAKLALWTSLERQPSKQQQQQHPGVSILSAVSGTCFVYKSADGRKRGVLSFSAPKPEAPHDAVLRGDEAAVRSWLEI